MLPEASFPNGRGFDSVVFILFSLTFLNVLIGALSGKCIVMLHSVLCIISTTTSFVGIFVRFTNNYNNFVMHFIRLIVYCFNPLPDFF